MKKYHKQTLIGIVGAGAATLTIALVSAFEGHSSYGYLDPVGIPTKCFGDTENVIVGKQYNDAECKASLEDQLVSKASSVYSCTPVLSGHIYQTAAAVSFAYNIGTSAYCSSTTAKRFNSGDWKGACKAMNESDNGKAQWVTARGVLLPGLIKRRAKERAICETDLPK